MVRISLYTAISCAMEARVCVYILGIQTIAPHTQSQGICTEVVSIRIWNNNMNTYSIWKWLWHGFISVIFFFGERISGLCLAFRFSICRRIFVNTHRDDAFHWLMHLNVFLLSPISNSGTLNLGFPHYETERHILSSISNVSHAFTGNRNRETERSIRNWISYF